MLARRMGKTRIIAETGSRTARHGNRYCLCVDEYGMYRLYGQDGCGTPTCKRAENGDVGRDGHPVTSGNMTLKDATNEAIRDWCCHPSDTYYIIGSTVGPHPYPDMVARLQSVISEEIKKQLSEQEGRDYPDYLIACVGGGSNAAGTIHHFIDDERVKSFLPKRAVWGLRPDKAQQPSN